MTNWSVQKDIWTHVFRNILKINPVYCSLLITEAPFALPSLQVYNRLSARPLSSLTTERHLGIVVRGTAFTSVQCLLHRVRQ